MAGQKLGYIRVSSADQNTERQLVDLDLDLTFTDKMSGKDKNRPELIRCMNYIRNGDELFVHSIDRLARNLFDLQGLVKEVIDKGACVYFIKENLRFSGDDDPMSVMVLQVMGAIAQFQRTLIKSAQLEGIARAKLAGKYKGGVGATKEKIKAIKFFGAMGFTKTLSAHMAGVSLSTIYKYWPVGEELVKIKSELDAKGDEKNEYLNNLSVMAKQRDEKKK